MRWKAIVAALVLFFAGVLSGVMGQRLIEARQATQPPSNKRPFPGGPPMPWTGVRMSFMERLTKDLELTPDQAKKIDQIIKSSQERLRALWEPVAPKARAEMTNSHAAISAVLTPEQQKKMEELFKRRGPGRRGPSRYHGGEGGPNGKRWEGERWERPPGKPPGPQDEAPPLPPGNPPPPPPDEPR